MKLIILSEISNEDPFLNVVKRLRKRAAAKPPTLEEITREVESVSSKRYASKT